MIIPTYKWFLCVGVVVFLVIACQAYNIVYLKNYIVAIELRCDESSEKCFKRDCDSSYEKCTNGSDFLIYKVIEKKANKVPLCDPFDGGCEGKIYCEENEQDCKLIYCDNESESLYGGQCLI